MTNSISRFRERTARGLPAYREAHQNIHSYHYDFHFHPEKHSLFLAVVSACALLGISGGAAAETPCSLVENEGVTSLKCGNDVIGTISNGQLTLNLQKVTVNSNAGPTSSSTLTQAEPEVHKFEEGRVLNSRSILAGAADNTQEKKGFSNVVVDPYATYMEVSNVSSTLADLLDYTSSSSNTSVEANKFANLMKHPNTWTPNVQDAESASPAAYDTKGNVVTPPKTYRLTNVAAGYLPTDAVNLAQLTTATARLFEADYGAVPFSNANSLLITASANDNGEGGSDGQALSTYAFGDGSRNGIGINLDLRQLSKDLKKYFSEPEGIHYFSINIDKDRQLDNYWNDGAGWGAEGAIAIGPKAVVASTDDKSFWHNYWAENYPDDKLAGTALGYQAGVRALGGVALGSSSYANRDSGVKGYGYDQKLSLDENNPLKKAYDKESTWKATAGAVSVGNTDPYFREQGDVTRQITNVAAGTEPTDAVNVAQLMTFVNQGGSGGSIRISSEAKRSDITLLSSQRLNIYGDTGVLSPDTVDHYKNKVEEPGRELRAGNIYTSHITTLDGEHQVRVRLNRGLDLSKTDLKDPHFSDGEESLEELGYLSPYKDGWIKINNIYIDSNGLKTRRTNHSNTHWSMDYILNGIGPSTPDALMFSLEGIAAANQRVQQVSPAIDANDAAVGSQLFALNFEVDQPMSRAVSTVSKANKTTFTPQGVDENGAVKTNILKIRGEDGIRVGLRDNTLTISGNTTSSPGPVVEEKYPMHFYSVKGSESDKNYDNSGAVNAKSGSMAAGVSASVKEKVLGTAIGSGSAVEVNGGVAVGSSSVADVQLGVEGWHGWSEKGDYTGHVWVSTSGAFSVGSSSAESIITRQIVNVAAGTNDTDAANVAQLKGLYNYVQNLKISSENPNPGVSGNITYGADEGDSFVLSLDHSVTIKGADQNIRTVAKKGSDGKSGEIGIKLSDDVKVNNSVTVGGTTKIDNTGVYINNGPQITQEHIDMGGKQIVNMADGVRPTDAVTVRQLNAANAKLSKAINDVDKRAKAGIAQAIATAGLPQAYLPGKNMLAAAGGTFGGQSAFAVGFSSISDNGKWIFKGTASGNTQSKFGASVGVGYQF